MSFKKLIQLNLSKRWFVLGLFLLITILSATQLPKLRFDFSPEAMLEFSQEEIDYQNAFNEKFQTNPNIFLLVFSSENSLIEPESLKDLRDLTTEVGTIPGVSSSYSLAMVPDNDSAGAGALLKGKLDPIVPEGEVTTESVEKVRARLENSSLLKGNLISDDGKHALIMLSLDAEYVNPEQFYTVYEKADEIIKAWQKNDNNGDYKIDYGGLPYIRSITVDTMKREQLLLWPIVGLLYIIALCVLFRSFWQAIMPLISIGCVIVWAIAIMVLNDMPVTMINNTLPLLIMVIGVTNGIYIIMRILDERRKGKDKSKSITDGVYRVALATLLTTATTSIGFGSLLVAKTKILNGFGGITALAVMLIYVAIIFLMPQSLSLINLEPKKAMSSDEPRDGILEKFLGKTTDFTVRHHKVVIAVGIAFFVACLAVATQIRFDSKVNDVFEEDHPITLTNTLIEKELGGMLPVEIDIWTKENNYFRSPENLSALCGLQKKLGELDGVLSTVSICSMLAEGGVKFDGELPSQAQVSGVLFGIRRFQPEQYNSYVTEDGNNVHISLRIPDNGFENSKQTIAQIRKIADETYAGSVVEYRLTGIGYNSTLGLEHFMTDLFTSLLTAFIIIFGLLFIAFRSFWSGSVAILPNLIPISMTLAFLPIYGYNLNTTSVLVFTISIGLAVDNSIHIITRFRQEYRGERTVPEALRNAMTSSGRAILQSNFMLCTGLAVLLLSDFDPIRRVGVLTITTIAAALLVSIILIPAEIAVIGHKMRLPKFKKELEQKPESVVFNAESEHAEKESAKNATNSTADVSEMPQLGKETKASASA
ncbi:MAG: MMPL family transporter [Proteobacteria bacterium]|nr:MMPL family transporter [Pseudomonadota bacterium]